MPLSEDYEIFPPTVPGFENPKADIIDFDTQGLGVDGGSPTKSSQTKSSVLGFNAKDLAHPESNVQATHPSPLWTPLQFLGGPGTKRMIIKVGSALREIPGNKTLTPQHMVDDEDGPAHIFKRAPALEVLHDQLTEAGVHVSYRNEPGDDMTFKLIFLDAQVSPPLNS